MVIRVVKRPITVGAALAALMQLAAVGCGTPLDDAQGQTPSAAGVAVAALEQGRAPSLYAVLPGDPIAAVGHGVVVTADGSIVDPTPDFVRNTQRQYIDLLLGAAGAGVREELEQERLRSEPEAGADREFALRAALIDLMLDRVQPSGASDISAKNRFLVYAVEPVDLAFVEDPNQKTYAQTCREQGVPTPPDWADDPATTGWTSGGRLDVDFLQQGDATVWYKVSTDSATPGLCVALPRVQPATETESAYIGLLGVICQGKVSGKVCFWDNREKFYLPITGTKTIAADFVTPDEIEARNGDRCTLCHRGENAYIVHPGSNLDIDLTEHGAGWKFNVPESYLRANQWVEPLVNGAWPKNERWSEDDWNAFTDIQLADDGVTAETSCIHCHDYQGTGGELGQFGTQYCSTVMSRALDRTMPPLAYLEGTDNPDKKPHTPSIGHRDFITSKCATTPND